MLFLASNTPYPSGVKKFQHMCMCDAFNSVFQAKKQHLCSKIGVFGANGVKGSKFIVENVIFGIADPNLRIHYPTVMGIR